MAPNKAIVGENAFAHESGIHQHGVLENAQTYEIMTPQSIGLPKNEMVLGKHSGRHAFEERLTALGYELDQARLDEAFARFKKIADRKKSVSDEDLQAIVGTGKVNVPEYYSLVSYVVNSGNAIHSTGFVSLRREKEQVDEVAIGEGPIDALYKAIDKLTGTGYMLDDYTIRAVTAGEDALGEVLVRLKSGHKVYTGRGVAMDIIESSILAYLNAVNKIIADRG